MGCAVLQRCYRGSGNAALHETAMPEPYVGDPLAPCLLGVALNLNPGSGLPPQLWPDGALVGAVREHGYHAVNRRWALAPETVDWWAISGRWLRRLSRTDRGRDLDLVGIDFFPWHSPSTGQLKPDERGLQWLDENVLQPAAAAARGTPFGAISIPKHGAPAVVAVGKAFVSLLDGLHFDLADACDHKAGPARFRGWPEKAPGVPTTRSLRVYRSLERGLVVLQTSAPGGNTLPREAFDGIIREMLGTRA